MPSETLDFAQLRRAMVDNQLRTFSITERNVLAQMEIVPREAFLPAELAAIAYSDAALTVHGRRMLSPMVFARMVQTAGIKRSDRILDVAGAAGYSAAVLAGLGDEVVALEVEPALTEAANAGFRAAGVANARAVTGPLEAGFAAGAPFDVIVVNGLIEVEPSALLAQLAEGGRLVAVVRQPGDQAGRAGRVTLFEKNGALVGGREVFDAAASLLPGFGRAPAFAF